MISTTVPQSRSGFNFYTSLIFILCLSLSGEVIAGAWTAKQGASYQKLGVNYFFSDENFDDDGDRKDSDADFRDVNLTYYMEYGITDKVTGFASIPYKWIKNDPDDGGSAETWGIGDQEYGLRYNLFNEDWGVFSIQGLVKVPDLNDDDNGENDLPLGNDQVDYELRLLYGRSLYPKPVYFGLEAGYRWRREAPSDEIRYLVEIGYNINEKTYVRTKLDGTLSADNADDAPPTTTEANPTLAPAFDLGKLELTAGYKIDKKFSTEFTWTPYIYGQNTAAGNNFQFAVIMQLP
jgi:hypothetical protein